MFFNLLNSDHPDKKRLEKTWLATFDIIMGTIKFFVFMAAAGLVYIVFGDAIKEMLRFEKPPTPEQVEARKRAYAAANAVDEFDKVENGIHVMTGLKVAEGWEIARGVCTACHSAKLITQTRATRDGWKQMIRWMQETQGLWDLGDQESTILDYLAANYAPEEESRRPNLNIEAIEWYVLDLENTAALQ
jgi:hypothetical protein